MNPEELNEQIGHYRGKLRNYRAALERYRGLPAVHYPPLDEFLCNLADALEDRFEQLGDLKDINEAVALRKEAIQFHEEEMAQPWMQNLPPDLLSDQSGSLSAAANSMLKKFDQLGDPNDLDEAIRLHRKALALRPQPHPNRSDSLNNLANTVLTRSEQGGDSNDVDEAITFLTEALTLCVSPHDPVRGSSLTNLGNAVLTRFYMWGNPADIDEAIKLQREALALRPFPHPHHKTSLSNLACAIWPRFEQQGHPEDIDESIQLHREALILFPAPHPGRSGTLNNLATVLQTRFEQRADPIDIDEAIALHREALELCPEPHSNHGTSLNGLGIAILKRFDQRSNPKDLDEAIETHRMALAVRSPGHPNRNNSLQNLAAAIGTKFTQQEAARDIDEVIELLREALSLCSGAHPNRSRSLGGLASSLRERFISRGDRKDIDEAVELGSKGLSLCDPPHSGRDSLLENLGTSLLVLYTITDDIDHLDNACSIFREAATYSSASPLGRFRHAHYWAKNAAGFAHISALDAYQTAIELLPQLAAFHLDLPSRQHILSITSGSTFASDAASYAVGKGLHNTAVEWLEASRSVFWSQALSLRTPLDHLATIRPDLSTKLTDLSRQLEMASFQNNSWNELADTQQKLKIEREAARCRQLNDEWEQVINDVRMFPEFNDFMQPKGMDALKKAAVSGPVIILTTTGSTCFALIVTLSEEVQCLKLSQLVLSKVHLLADLSRGLSKSAFDFATFVATRGPVNEREAMSDLKDRLYAGRERSVKVDPDEVFRELLADLWKNIKSNNPPRLWWCPSGPFAFLPIHAAGIYGKKTTDCAADYVISCYTHTLTALLDPPVHIASQFKMTAVIQPSAPGCSPLPGARHEEQKLRTRVPKEWLTVLLRSKTEEVVGHLRDSSIVHFACHGVQDLQKPLDSGLILSDGRLKVSEIMRKQDSEGDNIRQTVSIAFLSACETARGDTTVPDEAMHLAATLLFAGFRGVVATMWSMDDRDGPKIADTFYEYLFKSCRPDTTPPVFPDLTQAAEALHVAVGKLREEQNIPFRRWVPFVYYGL
ncbi:CHAT domain-containing protein [Mycena galopus ATCC 62051]|nr:CHAT domain-containing protein [Mycena galopus ATCC 62051]